MTGAGAAAKKSNELLESIEHTLEPPGLGSDGSGSGKIDGDVSISKLQIYRLLVRSAPGDIGREGTVRKLLIFFKSHQNLSGFKHKIIK